MLYPALFFDSDMSWLGVCTSWPISPKGQVRVDQKWVRVDLGMSWLETVLSSSNVFWTFDANLFWRTFHILQIYEATLLNLQHPSMDEDEWHYKNTSRWSNIIFLIFLEIYSPFTLNGHVFTQFLMVLFCSPKSNNFSDKFYFIYKILLFPATLTSALVIPIQIIWLLCCFTKNNYIWCGAMSYMNLLRNLRMRKYVSIFYPTC